MGGSAVNIAIFAGEVSGDLIGGALAREILRLAPEIKLWGIGGDTMRMAGVELVEDCSAWGAMGVTQALKSVPGMVLRIGPKMRAVVRSRRPDVVVLIDFGAFNVRAAKFCKSLGLKVVYYFPPGTWRRSGAKGAELAALTDLLLVPFQWAEERYRSLGANVVNVGHPMLERVRSEMSRAEFAGHFGMDPDHPIVGLLPGSRKHEVAHIMPALLDSARRIHREIKETQFVVGVAPSISLEMMHGYLTDHAEIRDRLSDLWHEFTQEAESKVWKPVQRTANALTPRGERQMVTVGGVVVSEDKFKERLDDQRREADRRDKLGLPPTVLAKGLTYEVMAHSDVLLTCSGTATLEAALFETPMVIVYRGSKIMEIEYYLRGFHKTIPHIGLPNILANRRIVPELIQREATPEAIAGHAIKMLNDMETRHRIKSDLRALRHSLGEVGASERAARLILEVMEGHS
jgi:lipid A disaccharide synthetase